MTSKLMLFRTKVVAATALVAATVLLTQTVPAGQISESAPYLFQTAALYKSRPVVSQVSTACQSSQVDIRGVVTKLQVAGRNRRRDELGFILVEGRKEADTQVDRAVITVTRSTRVWRQSANRRVRAAFTHLKVGDRVAVRFVGPVRESYPVGATAGDIIILPQERTS